MNLRRRIERIKRQADLRLRAEQESGPEAEEERLVAFVERLHDMPVEELVPGEPELDERMVEAYYAITLSRWCFVGSQAGIFNEADRKEWDARERHAESLVKALAERIPASRIRATVDASRQLWASGWRIRANGAWEAISPPRNLGHRYGPTIGVSGRRK